MTAIAIIAVAFFCLIAFVVAVQAVREVEIAKLTAASNFVELPSGELVIPAGMKVTAPACPCRNLTSLTVGSVHEIPPGTIIPPAAEPDPVVMSFTQRPIETADLNPEILASWSVKATEEVKSAFEELDGETKPLPKKKRFESHRKSGW